MAYRVEGLTTFTIKTIFPTQGILLLASLPDGKHPDCPETELTCHGGTCWATAFTSLWPVWHTGHRHPAGVHGSGRVHVCSAVEELKFSSCPLDVTACLIQSQNQNKSGV